MSLRKHASELVGYGYVARLLESAFDTLEILDSELAAELSEALNKVIDRYEEAELQVVRIVGLDQ